MMRLIKKAIDEYREEGFVSMNQSILNFVRTKGLSVNAKFYDRFWFDGGTLIEQKDWDILIILDGCRLDLYKDVTKSGDRFTTQPGSISSAGSSSAEFIEENFEDENFHDTVYVTANPHVHHIDEDVFYSTHDLINNDEYWDTEKQVVLPSSLASQAIEISGNYPKKRFIIHFMQPHFPFIGPSGDQLKENRGVYGYRANEIDFERSVWKWANEKFFCDIDTIYDAYRENLEIALPHVQEINDNIEGKTVVTSDHGNLVGDRYLPVPVRSYGHPSNRHVPDLINVPWHELEYESRRNIRSEAPKQQFQPPDETPKERLRALGYTE